MSCATMLGLAATPAAALELALPIACELGENCWVQQYADRDPGPGVTDYACGSQSYDGHDGTDIRIRDTAASADVIASASGTVKAVRDGVTDRLAAGAAEKAAVKDRECGNGVVVSHGDGWETQYCHMRKGSLAVKPGDPVTAGQRLGEVGYSGMAAFPHVHLSVRRNGVAVDPFRPSTGGALHCGGMQDDLWTDAARAALAYRGTSLLRAGFAAGAVDLAALESGALPDAEPTTDWPAMVAYVWAINLREGDRITLALEGPGGFAASDSVTIDRSKAQYMLFTGRKRPAAEWPKGRYAGSFTLRSRNGFGLSREWSAQVD